MSKVWNRATMKGLIGALVILLGAGVVWAVNSGSWTQPDLEGGTWTEYYVGGGPGQAGNTLEAHATSGQWDLTGFVLQTATPTGSTGSNTHGNWAEYSTVYSGGQLSVAAGPWGEAFTVTGMTATNISQNYDTGYLVFTFTGNGMLNGQQSVKVTALFAGNPDSTEDPAGHTGSLGEAALEISGPEPGVPTLSSSGLVVLTFMLAGAGLYLIRRLW